LVIEEINRGNCAEIFGDIFQLLDRNSNYTVSPSEELKKHLIEKLGNENHEGIAKGLKLPPNLTIYATMNTSDQSLFPMDSAFKRRWEWEYVPINYEELNDDGKSNESFHYKVFLDDEKVKYFNWIDFIKKVNEVIETNENLGMDKCIGNYFIKSETKEIAINEFVNKVIFYLWNDVFKDEQDSIFEKGITFEKFFPINKNALPLIEKLLSKIDVPILPKAE
jgi:5-methylcytosine-specific restriction endonuclease McrBC GTP-binding regulatory subunit McrB